MANLIIEMFSQNAETGVEQRDSKTTIPLVVAQVMAKHAPDRLMRFIYGAKDAERNTVELHGKAIMDFFNGILQELNQHYASHTLQEPIFESTFTTSDDPEQGVKSARVIMRIE